MNRSLWQHQTEALETLRQTVRQGVRRIVLSSPTGSGKTLLSAAVIESALEKGHRVCFVVSSISLVDQTYQALYQEDIRDVGVVQANHFASSWSKPVTIASIQTIQSRGAFPSAQVVIIDECHVLHNAHKSWLQNGDLDHKRDPETGKITKCGSIFIGLSATPYTRGLANYFDTLITVATTQEMIDRGVLSPFKVWATGHPDLKDVKVVAGDYHEGQLSDAMQQGTLTADIVRTWGTRWGKDKTLCFGVDCAHAKALQQRFEEAGIRCGYQDARTTDAEREDIKRMFHNGGYQVVSNVGTLTTGTDWDVRCLVLARPTRSETLYKQIVGRALRTAQGKDHAVILDHSDTTQKLGFVTDIEYDHLDNGERRAAPEPRERLPKECKACAYLKPVGVRKCPHCGFEPVVISGVIEKDGELVEMVPGQMPPAKKGEARKYTMVEKSQFLAELKAYGVEHGYKPGWALNKYRDKFEVWPDNSIAYVAPARIVSVVTLGWIKNTQIAWAKSQSKREVQYV
jgi:DNA repair protein RadD